MAIGGFLGSALAGLSGYDRAQQEAQQNQYRQIQQRMLMQEMQQRQQQERQQQEAMRLAYGGLGGLGGLGGAPPLQGMPQTPMPQMGGGQPDQLMPPQAPSALPFIRNPRTGGVPAGTPGASPAISSADAAGQNAQLRASGFQGLPVMPSDYIFGKGLVAPPGAGSIGGGLAAGGIPARGTPERERLKAMIYGAESGGQNIEQGVLPPGGGYNPSVGRVTGPSSASGYGQITDSTWRDTPTGRASGVAHAKNAPFEVQDKAVDDLIDKRGVQPWAPYNAKLREDLQRIAKGGQALGQQVAQDIPPMAQGRMGLAQMKEAIDKAAPDADGATKMMAIMQLHQMLAPYEKMQFQQYMKDNQNEFRAELQRHQQEFQDKERQEREKFQAGQKDKSGTGFETFRDPSGNLHYIKKGDAIPEGFQRDNKRFVGAQGMALQTFIDEFTRENGKPPSSQDIRGWQTSNAMATAEGRTVGGRTAMLETAANAAEAMGPLLIEASEKISRTEYPDINKIILAYEEKTGSPEVIQYGEMLNTMRYLYARALSPTGQARVADLQNFDKIMTAAWTKGQIKAGIDQINKSLGVERQAIQKTKEGVMNQPGVTSPKGAPAPASATPAAPAAAAKGGVIKLDADGNVIP